MGQRPNFAAVQGVQIVLGAEECASGTGLSIKDAVKKDVQIML